MFDTPQERIEALKAGVLINTIEYCYNYSHDLVFFGIEPVHELELKR